MRLITPIIVSVVLAAAAVAGGCGDSGKASSPRTVTTPATGFLAAPAAERLLGNTFRRALGRRAIMTQPGDDAADLGQQLPSGLVDDVRCRPAGVKPTAGTWRWRCDVRWQTVAGDHRRTGYAAALTDHGCLYANARPALAQIRDSTTHAPAEDPLNVLVGAVKGC